MNITLLFTPGLDSFVADSILSKHLKEDDVFTRVYFNLKHRYAEYELDFLRKWYPPGYFKICNSIYMGYLEKDNAYIPNRNLILVSYAQSLFNSDIIYLNGVKDDRVSDNDEKFRKQASSILTKTSGKTVKVLSLFDTLEKSEIVENYCNTVSDEQKKNLIEKTFSCYDKDLYEEADMPYFKKVDEDHYEEIGKTTIFGCMSCAACFRRMCALTAGNLYVPFFDFTIIKKYYEDVLQNKISRKYFPNRIRTINNYYKFMLWFGCD